MRIGIDLLWVRVGKCGGTESFIRNLMDGFLQYDGENDYVLFTAEDNQKSFVSYCDDSHFSMHVCPVNSESRMGRVLFENVYLDRLAAKLKIEIMFIPVYTMPRLHGSGIPYVTQIHDLQALHYPEYFSIAKRIFFQKKWCYACKKANAIVTISDFCKKDLIRHFPYVENKIHTIYVPIVSKPSGISFEGLQKRYGIEKGRYFYCVSSLLPHKNLKTILAVMQERKRQNMTAERLVISGVGGNEKELMKEIKERDIQEFVVETGFVKDEERDCLYENCELLLFPSFFEGFGMPAIEAMRRGKAVVTTDKSSLVEVTEGKAVYVSNPTDVEEWMQKIKIAQEIETKIETFEKYSLENVVKEYLEIFRSNCV